MDSDGIYNRINVNKVIENIQKNNSDMTESKAHKLSYIMIREFNRKIDLMVRDFENGEGDFMSCYFDAMDKI